MPILAPRSQGPYMTPHKHRNSHIKWIFLLAQWCLCGICSLSLTATSLAAGTGSATETGSTTKKLNYTILEEKKHDTNSFTQGLFWQDGKLYESSGLYGKSFLRRYDANNLNIEQQVRLPARFFAEGLTLYQDKLYLLTWQAGTLLVYDKNTFQEQKPLKYQGQGWGLSHDGKHFVMSDGSDQIYFRDSQSFEVVRKVQVHSKWRKYKKINELEFAEGAVWANVWLKPYILKISPDNGEVLGIASFSDLVSVNTKSPRHAVLNGIAYDKSRDAFWITGKLWPKSYLIRFNEN